MDQFIPGGGHLRFYDLEHNNQNLTPSAPILKQRVGGFQKGVDRI
jgi:hypothetical protein